MNSLPPTGNSPAKPPSTVFDVFGILWRWRWVIVAMTLLAFFVAAIYTMRQTKIYEAEASALVQRQSLANSLNNILSPGAQANEGPRVVTAQAQLAKSPVIAERTLKQVPSANLDVGQLLASVTVEADAGSDVLHFKLQNESGPLAVRLVNVYAREYVIYSTELSKQSAVDATKTVRAELKRLADSGDRSSQRYLQLQRNLDSLQSVVALTTPTAQVINTATGYTKVKPKLMIALVLGAFLGFGLGIGLAFLLEALDPRLRSPQAIADLVGLPLLAVLPAKTRGPEPVTIRGRDEASTEAYRVLLAAAENVAGSPLRGMLLVTSDSDPARASAAAVNLAIASARAGHATTLVDIGFSSPVLTTLLGAAEHAGISDAVIDRRPLRETMLPIKAASSGEETPAPLRFVPVGTKCEDPSELIGSDAVKEALEDLDAGDGIVIVDTGAVAGSSGAVSAASVADHTLLVGSTEKSRPQELEEAGRSIALGKSEALGVAAFD